LVSTIAARNVSGSLVVLLKDVYLSYIPQFSVEF